MMNGDKMKKTAARAKKWNLVIFGVFAAAFVALIIMGRLHSYQHSYSQYEWDTNKENRYKIVGDMLEQYQLIGMTEAEVIQLLGDEDSSDITSFKNSGCHYVDKSTLVYWLGVDFMDDKWLVISLNDDVVIDYFIGLT